VNLDFFKKKDLVEPLSPEIDEVIMVVNLKKSFFLKDKEVEALKNISFSVKKGEFFVIKGASGSGKTSLLNILGAMETTTSGRVAINGKTLDLLSEKQLTLLRRLEIATIYQSYNLIPVLNAFQNVELPLMLSGLKEEERLLRTKKLLKLVGLEERMEHIPEELSGGEQQRVAIARSLSNKPNIIFADEPTGNLDEEIQIKIMKILEGINRDLGTTIIMVTHDLKLAERADRILELKNGEILEIREGKDKDKRIKDLEKVHLKEGLTYIIYYKLN
jgi:putative ABC transport system ATP-binding protein